MFSTYLPLIVVGMSFLYPLFLTFRAILEEPREQYYGQLTRDRFGAEPVLRKAA